MMNHLYLILVVFVTLILTYECSSPVGIGGGSETTNRFTACVHDTIISGRGLPGYSVQCYDTGYIPYLHSDIRSTAISDDSTYTLHVNVNGIYNLYSFPTDTSRRLPSSAITNVVIALEEDTSYSKEYALPGTIQFLSPVDSIWPNTNRSLEYALYLVGTPFSRKFTSSTRFPIVFNNIPESRYSVKCKLIREYVTTSNPTITIKQSIYSSDLIDIDKDSEVILQLVFTQ